MYNFSVIIFKHMYTFKTSFIVMHYTFIERWKEELIQTSQVQVLLVRAFQFFDKKDRVDKMRQNLLPEKQYILSLIRVKH